MRRCVPVTILALLLVPATVSWAADTRGRFLEAEKRRPLLLERAAAEKEAAREEARESRERIARDRRELAAEVERVRAELQRLRSELSIQD